MNRQYTGWGYIDWMKPDTETDKAALNVGVVSIVPHAHMNAHIHFTEQVLYTLQGTGYSLVDGKKVDMSSPNVIFHWKASVIHEMYNTGDTVFKHLMISCPDTINLDEVQEWGSPAGGLTAQEAKDYLHQAIEEIRQPFLSTLHYSYIIFDAEGNLATHTNIFPAYCSHHCGEKIRDKSAPCMQPKLSCPICGEGRFECPFGLTILYAPIVLKGTFLGHVEGGFIHTALTDSMQEGVYVTPQSSILGAQLLLRNIAKAIINCCEFHKFQKDLMDYDVVLADKQRRQDLLQASLKEAETAVTNLQINNHFLFNTLNQMASMAIEGGMLPLYQSIVDLSKIFYYTLRNNGTVITLDKEVSYLQSYLKLQKLRYGAGLQVTYDVTVHLEQWVVPFNFLMPLVENAFTHGFPDEEEKRLVLRIHKRAQQLYFEVANNGTVLEDCRRITESMHSNTAHGLSMVYRKLQASYDDAFCLQIASDAQQGTRIDLTIPAIEAKGDELSI